MFPSVLVSIIVVALVCGLLSLLIAKMPLISGDYKAIAQYALLVCFVLWLISVLFGYSSPIPLRR